MGPGRAGELTPRDAPLARADPPEPERGDADEVLLVAEAQLLLAEKRTSLSTIRTGIAVAALPLSVVSILIATSRMYDAEAIGGLLVTVLVACGVLFLLSIYLMVHAMVRMRHHDRRLRELRDRNRRVGELLE